MLGCCTIAEVQQNTENTSNVETEKIYSFKERIEVILNLIAIGPKKNLGLKVTTVYRLILQVSAN